MRKRVLGQDAFFGMAGCLLWLVLVGSPWAASAGDVGLHQLECALGAHSDGVCREWVPTDRFRADLAASLISDELDVWSDGSCVGDALSLVEVGVVYMLIGLGLVGFKRGGASGPAPC